jgi:hypothetical protein
LKGNRDETQENDGGIEGTVGEIKRKLEKFSNFINIDLSKIYPSNCCK